MDVEQLTWTGASYINLLAQLRERYPQTDLEKQTEESGIDDIDQQNLAIGVQQIKGFVFRTYVKFNALSKQIKDFESYKDGIKTKYEEISKGVIPTKESVENFIVSMNELFVTGVIGELLGSSGDVLRSLTK